MTNGHIEGQGKGNANEGGKGRQQGHEGRQQSHETPSLLVTLAAAVNESGCIALSRTLPGNVSGAAPFRAELDDFPVPGQVTCT
jgi:hypothetical protein